MPEECSNEKLSNSVQIIINAICIQDKIWNVIPKCTQNLRCLSMASKANKCILNVTNYLNHRNSNRKPACEHPGTIRRQNKIYTFSVAISINIDRGCTKEALQYTVLACISPLVFVPKWFSPLKPEVRLNNV
jgi:hypothetical protein